MRFFLAVLFATLILQAEYKGVAFASGIEDYYQPIEGRFLNVLSPCDPSCYIKVGFGEHGVFSNPTIGVDSDTLYALRDKPKRTMTLYYNSKEGPFLIDNLSGLKIRMVGAFEKHPIDIAAGHCFDAPGGGTTAGMYYCHVQVLYAWDIELNRVYKDLGGSENPELKAAQLAWIKYRDAQFKWIETEFGSRDGSKWINGVMTRKIELIRNQVERLQSYYKGW